MDLEVRPSSASEEDDNVGGRRRQRRRAASPRPHGAAAPVAVAARPLSGDRLGPDASGARHVVRSVEADGSSSQAAGLEPPPIDDATTEVTVPGPEEDVPVPDAAIGALALEVEAGRNGSNLIPQLGSESDRLGPVEASLGLPVGCTESHSRIFNGKTFSDDEQDPLPSMVSPTLIRFEVANAEPVQPTDQHDTLPSPLTACGTASSQGVPAASLIETNTEDTLQAPNSELAPADIVPLEHAEISTQPPPELIAVSPVTWRPAEEVLAADLLVDSGLCAEPREPCRVYVRRPRQCVQVSTEAPVSPPKTPSPSTAASSFIEQVTKPLDTTLPVPTVKQRCRQMPVGTEPPRRSWRIANLPPENHNPAATSVCRELGFTDENSKVTPAMVEKYEKFFKSPLERNHVKVMATMLNKELPDELPVRTPGPIVVA
ncbi:unnamed protein product [Urochloa humidicola]